MQKINKLNDELEFFKSNDNGLSGSYELKSYIDELSNLKTEEEKLEKWNIYTNEVIAAINKKYNYTPTYSEYQEYYRDYEQHLESLENTYDNK